MAMILIDPCARCKNPMPRSVCQGTPPVCGKSIRPGLCCNASDHWNYVGGQSVLGSANDSFTQKLRRYVQTGRRVKP